MTTDSQEWNNMWKAELTGFEWTRLHEQAISRAHSDASRRAMVKYWQTGSFRDGRRMISAELGAQWTDPGLVAQGILNGFIGYALIAKGGMNFVPEGKLANHLFKGAGKLADNAANRALIQNISNGKALGVDAFGKTWDTGVDAAGKSIYTYTQNGIVKGAGYMNMTSAEMIIKYGLK